MATDWLPSQAPLPTPWALAHVLAVERGHRGRRLLGRLEVDEAEALQGKMGMRGGIQMTVQCCMSVQWCG